jgi:hypothetical protein
VLLAAALMVLSSGVGAADSPPLLKVESVGARRGATVSVPVVLTGTGVYGGSFNVQYASELELIDAVGLIGGAVNKNYAPDTVRVSFASAANEVNGTLLTLKFRVRPSASFGEAAVTLGDARFFNESVEHISVNTQNGSVAVQSSKIILNHAKGVIGQAALVSVELGGEIMPAGGSFEIAYDNTKLIPINVKESPLMIGRGLSKNLAYKSNTVKVNWAGSEPFAAAGELFVISFRILDGVAPGETPLTITNLSLYDENALLIDSQAFGSSITMELPDGAVPEIILSRKQGGAADELTVLASVRGSDVVFGVDLELSFDPDKLIFLRSQSLSGTATVSEAPSGGSIIRIAWATPVPVAKSSHLAEITFRVNGGVGNILPGTPVTAIFYGDDGAPVDGAVTIDTGLAAIGENIVVIGQSAPTVASTANGSEISVNIELDTIALPESQNRTVDVVMAVYGNGRMTGFKTVEIELDGTMTADEKLTALARGDADTCKIMILSSDGTLAPLCANLQYIIGEG